MNLYSILCVSLTLVHQGFTNDTESPNDNSTFSSTENAQLEFTDSSEASNRSKSSQLEFSVTTGPPNEESTFSSTANAESPSINSTTLPCPEHMEPYLLTSQDPDDCFCVRPFLPIPLNGTCVLPFRQGPCAPGDFIPQSLYSPDYNRYKEEPRCIPNPCVKDGLVPANGTCIDIKVQHPCTFRFPYYNETISEIQCIRGRARSKSAITAPFRRKCSRGRRPDKYGKCRETL